MNDKVRTNCKTCNGEGGIEGAVCPKCFGTGWDMVDDEGTMPVPICPDELPTDK